MARGIASASSVTTASTTRELHTEELLTQLADCTAEAERADLTAQLVELNLGLCDALANRYASPKCSG